MESREFGMDAVEIESFVLQRPLCSFDSIIKYDSSPLRVGMSVCTENRNISYKSLLAKTEILGKSNYLDGKCMGGQL